MLRLKAPQFCRISREISEAVDSGDYLAFKYWYARQPGSPNVISFQYSYCPAVSSISGIRKNLRPIAELLRVGAKIDYLEGGTCTLLLPYLALLDRNWPLICLILYLRGLEAFTDIQNKQGGNAMDVWRKREIEREPLPYTRADEFLALVNQQKALVQEGTMLETQRRYFEAFEKYHQAAIMVLDFHQGDRNLIPFYQEEAAGCFYKAAQALVQDFSQAVVASSRLLGDKNMQAAKRTNLVCYITSEVMVKLGPGPSIDPRVDKDKLVGPEYFAQFLALISQWQRPQEKPDWHYPELDRYTYRPRSGSGASNGSGGTSCFSGSKDSVAS